MNAFVQTQLPQNVLEHIWNIIDENDHGKFDRKMFCMALIILYKIKTGA